jgi:hypothetical protein
LSYKVHAAPLRIVIKAAIVENHGPWRWEKDNNPVSARNVQFLRFFKKPNEKSLHKGNIFIIFS